MIIRGGENVYPREIEEFLHQHPKVSEARLSVCRISNMVKKSWHG